MHLAVLRPDRDIVDPEIHQMATSIGHVGAAVSNRGEPFRIRERTVDFGVPSRLTNTTVVDTWEVRLARDPGSETDVESVVPDA